MRYEYECRACGKLYGTNNARQKVYCTSCGKGRNGARKMVRATNELLFVGVDGEGVDRPNGDHHYVMLSVGEDTLFSEGRELTLREILSFLWECFTKAPDACYVGFFLGYDFIQWQKQLPEHVARSLLTTAGIAARTSQVKTRPNPYPDPVVWSGWEFDVMAGRRFRLRPHQHIPSKFDTRCRNRTCLQQLGNISDGPSYIYPGELEFTPDWEIDSIGWEGNTTDFWKRVVPHLHHAKGIVAGVRAKRGKGGLEWMYICDTGPFWQTSFLNVIEPSKWGDTPVCTVDEFRTIADGKSDRGHVYEMGDTSYYEEMARYNVLENDILARVTTRLNEGFMNSDIPIKIPRTDWYGPGRAAQIWMDMLHDKIADKEARAFNRTVAKRDRLNEQGLLNADVYMSMPSWFYDSARASYYGGWFEQFMHGHCGDVWEYDINSAYPFIIATLPCLHTMGYHNGQYNRGTDSYIPDTGYTLAHVTIGGTNPYIGAAPYRTKQGNIFRPHITKGWYWWHEILAAKDAGLVDTLHIDEWVSYSPCDCTPPFNPTDIGIEQLYALRLRVGKNTPQGIAAKLVYNSAYGKTAQSIGTPKYANPVYASLITAGCRTLILNAIASHPEGASAVSMVATDGVYFTSRHPHLTLDSTKLGAWDETFKPGMTQLMPGVYWDDNTRKALADGKSPKLKSRGVNAKDLGNEIANLDRLFALAHVATPNSGNFEWPSIEFRVRFLLDSCKSALHRGKWSTAGRVSHDTTRRISANPITKRNPTPYVDNAGYLRTHPYETGSILETTPYHKSFGYQVQNEGIFDGAVTQDGLDPMTYWRTLLDT